MSLSKNSKMLQFINYRVRVTLDDRRTLVGRFLAFDKHMNIVLSDCEEFRKAKKTQKDERRALGLLLLRGECVVSMAVESAPAPKKGKRTATAAGLVAADRAAPGRGEVMAALSAPAQGLGGPAQPQMSAQPRMYAPPPGAYPGGGVAPPPYGRGVPPTAYGTAAAPPPRGTTDVAMSSGRGMPFGRGAPPPS